MGLHLMTAFEEFFDRDFQRLLNSVPDERPYSCGIRSLKDSSWDRKAAFVLWVALGRPEPSTPEPVADDGEFDFI